LPLEPWWAGAGSSYLGFGSSRRGVIGALIAFFIGAVLCILVGLTYAELTAALPLAGGELVFAYRAMGDGTARFVGWVASFTYIGVAAWEGIAIATALDYMFPIPKLGYLWDVAGYSVYASWAAIGSIGALILILINHLGAHPSAIFQVMTTSFVVLVGLIFILGGITFGSPDYSTPTFTNLNGIIIVFLTIPSMFVGFDVIPQSAEEMNLPLRQIGRALIISIIMAALWYFLIIIGMSLSAPPEIRNSGVIPAADAMIYCYGSDFMGIIIILAGICGIMTSWNGFILGSTRIIFAMGRAKMLPPVFGKLHNKYKTPTGALILVGSICMLAPLLGKNALLWFVNASAFGSIIIYLMVAIAFLILRKRESELKRPFKIKHPRLLGIIVIVLCISFLFLYIISSSSIIKWPNEWLFISIWIFIGLIFTVITKKYYKDVSKEEREMLIFGEEYARKDY
jgi:APA family basic amino acid/polyamine antiporter